MRAQRKLNWQRLTHDGWSTELRHEDYNITGTLKFNNGRQIGKRTAQKLLKAYWHKLDRMFFGHAAKKGAGIERWVFAEYGELGDNLHFHFKAKAPTETFFFCCVANTVWSKFHNQTSSKQLSEITPTINPKNSALYVSKSTRQFHFDEAGFSASHRNKANTNIESFQNIAQAQRILNQISISELTEAQQIVKEHIAKAEKRIQLRQYKAEARGAQ